MLTQVRLLHQGLNCFLQPYHFPFCKQNQMQRVSSTEYINGVFFYLAVKVLLRTRNFAIHYMSLTIRPVKYLKVATIYPSAKRHLNLCWLGCCLNITMIQFKSHHPPPPNSLAFYIICSKLTLTIELLTSRNIKIQEKMCCLSTAYNVPTRHTGLKMKSP